MTPDVVDRPRRRRLRRAPLRRRRQDVPQDLRPRRDQLPGAGRRGVLRHPAGRLPAAAQRQRPAHHRRRARRSAAAPRSPARRAAPAAASGVARRRDLHHARRRPRLPRAARTPRSARPTRARRGRPSPTSRRAASSACAPSTPTTFYAFGPDTLLRSDRRRPDLAAPRRGRRQHDHRHQLRHARPLPADHRPRRPPAAHRERRRHRRVDHRLAPRRCSRPASPPPTRAVAAGAGGATAVSDDGGRNYAPVGGDIAGSFQFGLRLGPAPNIALALGARGQLARTTDNGVTWQAINVATSADMRDTSFTTRRRRLRARPARRPVPHRQRRRELAADRPRHDQPRRAAVITTGDTVLLAGPRGIRRAAGRRRVQRSSTTARAPPSTTSTAPASRSSPTARRTIVRTTNRGRAWTHGQAAAQRGRALAARPRDDVGQRAATRSTPTAACGARRNGGRRWTELPAIGTDDGLALAFGSATRRLPDARASYPADSGVAYVLRTTDGGQHWRPQRIASGAVPGHRGRDQPDRDALVRADLHPGRGQRRVPQPVHHRPPAVTRAAPRR